MRVNHLYVDDAGESHWRDTTVSLQERVFAPPAKGIFVSEPETAAAALFLTLPAGWDEPAHPSPIPQTLICVAGEVEVTASDGEARRIGVGDIWRMEDLHGKGHHTRVTSDVDFDCVIVQFA
ncbi:MAG: cupin [Pseudomonadota bacterium]